MNFSFYYARYFQQQAVIALKVEFSSLVDSWIVVVAADDDLDIIIISLVISATNKI
jgi:hypothetical protein